MSLLLLRLLRAAPLGGRAVLCIVAVTDPAARATNADAAARSSNSFVEWGQSEVWLVLHHSSGRLDFLRSTASSCRRDASIPAREEYGSGIRREEGGRGGGMGGRVRD